MKIKRLKLCLLLLLIALSTGAVQAQRMTAQQIHNQLAWVTDSMFAQGMIWGDLLLEVLKTKEFEQLKPARIIYQHYTEQQIKKVSKIRDAYGSQAFREAVIDYLRFELRLIEKGLMPFELLHKNTSDTVINTTLTQLGEQGEGENERLVKINNAQKAFARKNRLKTKE